MQTGNVHGLFDIAAGSVSHHKGIVRVEPQHGQLVQTRVFPDTEPYVDSACHLFAGQQGMYVVDRQNIYILTIA